VNVLVLLRATYPHTFLPLDGSLIGYLPGMVSDDGKEGVFGDLIWVSCHFASLLPLPAAAFPSSGSPELTVYSYTQMQDFARSPH
jgi:hypothetical protein